MNTSSKPQGEIQNAIIEDAILDDAGRGLLTAWIRLKFDGSGQGFGGYSLYLPKSFKHHEIESVAGHFIWRCMEVAGVTCWDHMKGKTVRADTSHSQVFGIGHIVNDDWFYPADDFANLKGKRNGTDSD